MNSAAYDVQDILVAAGLGLVVSTNLFKGQEPSAPANCVTVYDTPGGPAELTMDKQGYYHPAIQVRVRNTNYDNGYALIDLIKNVLHGLSHEVWNGTSYEFIQCDQDPFLLDYDGSGRPRFVCNFSIQRRPL